MNYKYNFKEIIIVNNLFIEVDNKFMLENEKYDHKEKFITLLLRGLSANPMGMAKMSVNGLLEMLSLSDDKKNKASLKETLAGMVEKEMIQIHQDFMKMNQVTAEDMKPANDYYFEVSNVSDAKTILGEDGEGRVKSDYTKITFEELFKFMKMKERNKHIALAIYHNIIRYIWEGISNPNKACNPTIANIVKETGLDKKTVTKYIKVLMDNELLYFETIREGYDKEKNYYVKWQDKASFKDHVEELRSYYDSRAKEKQTA